MPDIDMSGAVVQPDSPIYDGLNYAVARPVVAEYEITVSGSAAGVAPNVVLFRRYRGQVGDEINLAPVAGEIGTLQKTDTNSNPFVLDDDGFTAIAARNGGNQVGSFYFTFPDAQEFRLAHSEKVPNECAIAGNGTRETVPSGSNAKTYWIMNGSNGSGVAAQADLCVPTYTSTTVQIQGNASQPYGSSAIYTFADGFDFFGWNHVDHYQRADATNPTTANGTIETMFTSGKTGATKTTGTKTITSTAPVHGGSTTVQAATSAFNYLRIWTYFIELRAGQPNTHLSQMIDHNAYLATGTGTAYQCLYLTNNIDVEDSTFKVPIAASSWDNGAGIIRFIPDAWELSYATHYALRKSDGSWQTGLISELTIV